MSSDIFSVKSSSSLSQDRIDSGSKSIITCENSCIMIARGIKAKTPAQVRLEYMSSPRVVAESHATSVGEVSDRYGICKTQLFTWRRVARRSAVAEMTFAPVVVDAEP